MPVSAGVGLADVLGTLFAAAPEAAAAAAPEVAAVGAEAALPAAATLAEGAAPFAIPGFTITAPAAADLGATIGPGLVGTGLGVGETAAGVAPAVAGSSIGDVLGGLGAASVLGITPALGATGGGTVADRFGGLPSGTGALPIGAVPGFGPGGAPLPTAAPAGAKLPGVAGVGGSGAGGSQASGHDISGSSLDTSGSTDPALQGLEGTNVSAGGPGTAGPPTSLAPPTQAPGAAGNFFSKNAGLLTLLGAGLGGQLLAPTIANKLGLTNIPQQGPLTGIASQATGTAAGQSAYGTTLEQPLVTGQLPAPQQAQVDQALSAAIGSIRGKYASLGLSGSTMEASAIADAQQQSLVAKATIEQQMATTGLQAIQEATANMSLADQVYAQIMDAQISQDNQLQQSIGQFASALALGSAISGAKA